MDLFTDTASLALLVGFLLPPFIAVIQQPRFSSRTRAIITAVVSLVAGLVIAFTQGAFDSGQVTAATIVVVLIAANSTYKTLWSKIGVTQAVEGKTSRQEFGQAA